MFGLGLLTGEGITIKNKEEEIAILQSNLNDRDSLIQEIRDEIAQIQNNFKLEVENSIALNAELDKLTEELGLSKEEVELYKQELAELNTTLEDLQSDEYELVYLGDFKITHYCDERYSHVCGGNGVTASGKPTEVGVTAAADWSVLPKGSIVYIKGVGFREIQDVGGSVKGNHIDVLVNTHDEAIDFGIKYDGVWILIKKTS